MNCPEICLPLPLLIAAAAGPCIALAAIFTATIRFRHNRELRKLIQGNRRQLLLPAAPEDRRP